MRKLFLLLLILSILLGCISIGSGEESLPVLELHQIQSGCLDAYLLVCGNTHVLIDCGTNTDHAETNEELLADYLNTHGITHINAHIVTHYHNDHAFNTVFFSCRFGTEMVYGPTEAAPDLFDGMTSAYTHMKAGEHIKIGPISFFCYGPHEVKMGGYSNHDSLNFVLTHGERTFLFTGDHMQEPDLARYPELQNVDVLKFPHHGLEPFSISDWALRRLKPSIVLVPGNHGGDVYQKLYSLRIPASVYSGTDGNVILLCDGETIDVQTTQKKTGEV